MLQMQTPTHVHIQGGTLTVSLARDAHEVAEAQRLR